MIVGDTSIFAIESGITQAYSRPSLRALGFFVIHIAGRRYGAYAPDATMLANSFDEVQSRLRCRGQHIASFSLEQDTGKIADAVNRAIYAEDQEREMFFGISQPDFCQIISSKGLLWAPDGDEAFDDGSRVLQFDVNDRVRLIAFRETDGSFHDPDTLAEAWLPADAFYKALQQWYDDFEAEWASMPKCE